MQILVNSAARSEPGQKVTVLIRKPQVGLRSAVLMIRIRLMKKVCSGRHGSELVAGFRRNDWPESFGIF